MGNPNGWDDLVKPMSDSLNKDLTLPDSTIPPAKPSNSYGLRRRGFEAPWSCESTHALAVDPGSGDRSGSGASVPLD